MPPEHPTRPGSAPRVRGVARVVRRWFGCVLAMLAGLAAVVPSVSGQSPLADPNLTDPVVPGGFMRLDFVPRYSSWNSRYGPQGDVEPLGADLTRPDAASLFPGIASLEQSLRAMTGSSTDFTPVLGPIASRVSKQVTRLEFGARLGVFNWLTLGVMMPIVKARAPVDVAFRPDTAGGNLGLSPVIGGGDAVSALLTALADAVGAAQARAASLCDANPGGADCADATALSQRVGAFTNETSNAYNASPFFPLEGSAAAAALTNALDSLNQDLTGVGLAAIQQTFTFPTERIDASTFAQIPSNPAAGIRGSGLESVEGLWQMGDVEVSAMVRLLDGEVRDSGAFDPRIAWKLAGGVLVRLGTGQPADPDVFFSVGSGDGQTDIEGRVYGALQLGGHFEVRSMARYGTQKSTTRIRRVVAPGVILAPYASRQSVRWTPASYFGLQLSPRLHLTDQLSASLDYDYFRKGADSYEAAAAGSGGLDVTVLEQNTSMTVQQAGFGLTYATLGTWRQGRTGTPVEMNARLVRTISGTGGLTPKATRFEMGVRLFHRLWGGS